jgi:SdrD B-like domain
MNMSQELCQAELLEKTQKLMDGPLKHIRAAALAAALLPLASVAATPASAQQGGCGSAGTVCGVVFNDLNNNGIQDIGEPGIAGVKVFILVGEDTLQTETDSFGVYSFYVPYDTTYPISAVVPQDTLASPSNVGSDDTVDSDGVPNSLGYSVTSVTVGLVANSNTDFGFSSSAVTNPGTGTPGYWKNHPDAWPLPGVTVGGVYYPEADAIKWLGRVGKDKTTTMFSSLVSAILNVYIGNDSSCVATTIAAAHTWMATYGPVGSNVAASSYAWSVGEPLHRQMDSYNNGLLCAPHRN